MFWVVYVFYIDVLSVSMSFSVRFCIYEHIKNFDFAMLFENVFVFSEMTGILNLMFFIFKLLPRPWDLPHRV